MRNRLILIAFTVGTVALMPRLDVGVLASEGNEWAAMIDDCDPNADWGPGGCLLRTGTVSRAEFFALLASPLSPTTVVGHPSWRMDPGYLTVEAGDKVKLRNDGGRNHTFTKVAQFGGGVIPMATAGLTPVPECATNVLIPPGERGQVRSSDLAEGTNRFQCCFHPWMRAVIEVVPGDKEKDKP